jgi:uncharacterized ferritin-like protein (DUF455 family)
MGAHEETLVEAALRVLNTADPFEKAKLGDTVASRWLDGTIVEPYNPSIDLHIPDRPARLSSVSAFLLITAFVVFDEIPHWHESLVLFLQVKLVAPSLMPKLGKAGSLQSRVNIVHSLAHTESWAIDLSWVLTFLTLCFAVA